MASAPDPFASALVARLYELPPAALDRWDPKALDAAARLVIAYLAAGGFALGDRAAQDTPDGQARLQLRRVALAVLPALLARASLPLAIACLPDHALEHSARTVALERAIAIAGDVAAAAAESLRAWIDTIAAQPKTRVAHVSATPTWFAWIARAHVGARVDALFQLVARNYALPERMLDADARAGLAARGFGKLSDRRTPAVAAALGELATPTAMGWLVAGLREGGAWADQCARAIDRTKQVPPELRDLLSGPTKIALRAAYLVGALGGEEHRPALEALSTHASEEMRAIARRALRRLDQR